jgi:hypothetical protein
MGRKEKFTLSGNEKLSYGLLWTLGVVIYDIDMQHGDGRTYWPFHPVLLNYVVAPWVFSEFYRLLRNLKIKLGREKLAELLYSPAKLATYQLLWPLNSLKKVPSYKKIWLLREFANLLNLMRKGEPFCENFRNLVWKRTKINKLDDSQFLPKARNRRFFRVVADLDLHLTYYSELLNYCYLDFSRFYHGPYVRQQDQIFVKEFLSTKAFQRYEFLKSFPFDHYQQVGIYPREVDIKVFFLGHTHISKPYPQAIEKIMIKLDGEIIDDVGCLREVLKEVKRCYSKLLELMEERGEDEDFLLKHGIDCFFYHLRPLYDANDEDWKKILPKVYKFSEKEKKKVKIPPPWGEYDVYKAAKLIFRMCWRLIYGRSISQKQVWFMKRVEGLAKELALTTPSYGLIKALSLFS